MKTLTVLCFFLILALAACEIVGGNKFNTGTFPDTPVNLGDINSEYDDYNSTSPIIGDYFPLCFSSNRNSQGFDYDIVYKMLDVHMDRESGAMAVADAIGGPWNSVALEFANINIALSKINTSHNEFGPNLIPDIRNNYRNRPLFVFLYSNNESGNQDIKYVHNLDAYNSYTNPKPVTWLNSSKDDAYPTLAPDSSEIYFCSDRADDFDIYQVPLNMSQSIRGNIEDTMARAAIKVSALSSPANDKCPFILENLMVFASDRSGGYGGYDLYYSVFSNGSWSAPVNFGEKVNTKYDEFRPIVKPFYDFTNDFMIFSSNRPGGKGGFDLYYVGIDKTQ